MATAIKKMGEPSNTTKKPRAMANVAMQVRDDGAEFLLTSVISRLEEVTTNKIDDKEEIEGICGEAVKGCYLILRALEKVGARTSPEHELRNRLESIRV